MNTEDDVKYWGLTPRQAARYHSRVAEMHMRTSERFREESAKYARRILMLARIETVFFAISAVLLIVSWLGALFGVFVF